MRAACLVLLLIVLGWLAWPRLSSRAQGEAPPHLTVAVLPFESDGSPVATALATGLSADLQTRLQFLSRLQCVPRTLVRRIVDPSIPAPEMGRRLGAELLLHGRVDLTSGRIRLTVILEPTAGDKAPTAVNLTEPAEAVLDLQRRLVGQVTEVLAVPISWRERRWMSADSTRSVKAWNYAAQALSYLESPAASGRAADFAADLFRSALQLDPGYSEARSGLGEALWQQ